MATRKKPVRRRRQLVQQAVGLIRGLPADYPKVLNELKQRVSTAQFRAAATVNSELVRLYLHIGKTLHQTSAAGWGNRVIERLAKDLRKAFPGIAGFSRTNVFYMRQVYEAWEGADELVQQLVGQIPWGHHLTLIARVNTAKQRTFYLQQSAAQGWSRAMLVAQIQSRLHARSGKAISNFARTRPAKQASFAQEAFKDPYLFDFLSLAGDAGERELERGLTDHVQKFLLELGAGFAFVGRQVDLEVSGQAFRMDLLFYHLRLRCYVVIDLKAGEFKPEYAGKMNFYLSAVDDQFRHPDDQPSIGLILCTARDRLIAEYALRDLRKPIGVSEWQTKLVRSLPKALRGSLPTVEEIEKELANGE